MTDQDALARQARETRSTSAGWMIQRLAARLRDDMRTRLDALGLKPDQFVILMMLAEMQGANQSEIGARVGMANYTVTRALDGLETRGLTERRPDEGSRRAHRVYLTEAGRALMPAVFRAVRRVNRGLLQDLPKAERALFLAALSRLTDTGEAGGCG